jgi:hypothetical protein
MGTAIILGIIAGLVFNLIEENLLKLFYKWFKK